MPRNKRLHFKDVNALKAIAFIPIYLFCILLLINNTNNGVLYDITTKIGRIALSSFDFYFFISAFLITSHGLREYKYMGHFSLKNFYARRFLRIIVVLLFALLFGFGIHPWLITILDLRPIEMPSIEPYFFLIPNYISEVGGEQLLYLKLTCTIYMFLQFFAMWGIVMKYLHKWLPFVTIGLIAIGIVSRIIHLSNGMEYALDTLAFGIPIGLGGLTAYAIRNNLAIVEKMQNFSKKANTVIYAIGTAIWLGGYLFLGDSYFSILIPIITSLFFGFVIIEQTFGKNSFVQLKTKKALSYIGKISYGLIIYQAIIGMILIIAAESLNLNLNSFYIINIIVIGGLIGSVIVADVSYKLFEKPLLRVRRAFKKV